MKKINSVFNLQYTSYLLEDFKEHFEKIDNFTEIIETVFNCQSEITEKDIKIEKHTVEYTVDFKIEIDNETKIIIKYFWDRECEEGSIELNFFLENTEQMLFICKYNEYYDEEFKNILEFCKKFYGIDDE